MAADFSRVRLDPLLDFAGLELKQGGVLLDADANELVGIVDRRLRALASDVLGRATVSATTPDAFKVGVSGAALTIGRGRLYVDGLLAECHGAGDREFDPLLAEARLADPVDHATQPYWPSPPALPTAGRHLVYLDVWNREVGHLERPELVESAVGVETSSRVQTVWQVRVLPEDAGANATCASPDGDLPGWAALIAPSTGVLTTGTFEVAPVDDPCELPPTGGYRGLENQLYRVEIHDGGQPGAGATFKWSRENASVGSRVATIVSSREVELESLGRDDVLSIRTGDWVEITDDVREFALLPGEIRRVTVDAATRRLQFTPALPAAMLPASFPDGTLADTRNMRVRRWDQSGKVFRSDPSGTPVEVADLNATGASGTIAVPAAGTILLLENGVTVDFASTGATGFRPGDYWVFAARTADASVELLERAPPRGIHHHYARLALWDVGAGTVTDCRHSWPPAGEGHDCSCTACVTAASHASGQFTIQDAVNQAAQTGGTVCIGPGQFALAEPVRMVGTRSVRVVGQGPATVLAAPGGAFLIRNGVAVGIERLAILSLARAPAIAVVTALGLTLRELVIAMLDATGDARAAAISLSGVVGAAHITDNAILASTAILANDPTMPRDNDAAPFLLAAALRIDGNLLWSTRRAVALDGRVLHLLDTRVTGNQAVACRDVAISATGIGAPGAALAITANAVSVTGDGIRCGTDGAWIADNKVHNTSNADTATVGIALVAGFDRTGGDQCQILANQISGFARAGVSIEAPVGDLIVKHNIVTACGNGIVSLATANVAALSIENNHLTDIGTAARQAPAVVTGIWVARAGSATIAANTIRSLGLQAVQPGIRAGVVVLGVARARIAANHIVAIGPPGEFAGGIGGIILAPPLGDYEVTSNHVDRDAEPVADRQSTGQWVALTILGVEPTDPTNQSGRSFVAVPLDDGRTVSLGGTRAFVAAAPRARTTTASPAGAVAAATPQTSGSVLGNTFQARGQASAVLIASDQCLFNDNRVDAGSTGRPAVAIAASVAVVNGNRVTGGELGIQITRASAKTAAVLGNVTTGAISLGGAPLPGPWDALNLRA